MKGRLKWSLLLALVLIAAGALAKRQADVFDAFAVSFSTPAGNEIIVDRVVFDDAWWVPGGRVRCCWGVVGPVASVFDRRMPREVYVSWRQTEAGTAYEATVELDADLASQARGLPTFTWLSDGRTGRGLYLIIGMKPEGEVTVWLSNARSDNNLRGRVLEVVGESQGMAIPGDEYQRRLHSEEGWVR